MPSTTPLKEKHVEIYSYAFLFNYVQIVIRAHMQNTMFCNAFSRSAGLFSACFCISDACMNRMRVMGAHPGIFLSYQGK